MKRNTLYLFLAISLGACKKEMSGVPQREVIPSEQLTFDNQFNISSNNQLLVFKTLADYERVVNMPDSITRVTFLDKVSEMSHITWFSYASKQKDATTSELINDDYFASILSKDLTVQIGDIIYRVNPTTKKVYALPTKYSTEYVDLLAENTNNSHIKVFSTNEDVLYLENSAAVEKCNEDGAGARGAYAYNNVTVNIDITVQYHKYGIYNSITMDATNHYSSSGTRIYIQMENIWYHQKCGYTVGPYSQPWWTSGNPANTITYLSYQGTKALNGYHVKARTRLEVGSTSVYTTYFTNWAEIEANSPY